MDRLPENKLPALRVMTMPADANQNGDIFGGWIMSHVDIAGGVLAGRTARGRVATVAVKEFIFKQPVQVGDVLSFYADLVRIGNTSITVSVEVYAERRPSDPKVVKVTQATLTYVAIDRDGRPRSNFWERIFLRSSWRSATASAASHSPSSPGPSDSRRRSPSARRAATGATGAARRARGCGCSRTRCCPAFRACSATFPLRRSAGARTSRQASP